MASTCRFCGAALTHVFADLGMSPLANSLVTEERRAAMEPFYPLRALVCDRCFLVQAEAFEAPERIFSLEYPYFSSYSTSWLAHAEAYADAIVDRLGLGPEHLVVELGSNDGYLLQFLERRGVRVLGVEPVEAVAREAILKGIPTLVRFFDARVARELAPHSAADLVVANNVLAHMPDVGDFAEGMRLLLKPHGVVTVEVQHLMRVIEEVQFDTIYHEHFSYFSLRTLARIFERHGLRVFDVEELGAHGGSLRVYACHAEDDRPTQDSVEALSARELAAGADDVATYTAFVDRTRALKRDVVRRLLALKDEGATIVGYGAPAKGVVLLNYCGAGTDVLDYTVDRNPHKQGCYLPGVRVPIRAPDEIARTRPDYVLILPWNLRDEIVAEMAFIREWGGRFLVRAPDMMVL
jgi:SAM-dependent methyltransferase